MRLATIDGDRVALFEDGRLIEIEEFHPRRAGELSAMRRLITAWGEGDLAEMKTSSRAHDVDEVSLLAPIPDPSKIFAAPVNYVDHQIEMNEAVQVSGLGLFLKAPSSVIGHQGAVRLPYSDRRFDQEGEVAVVIGRRARHVSEAEALSYVFGVTGLLDMTMRGGEDRSTRKSFDTFTPMGPLIATLDEVPDIGNLSLRCTVNGEVRQQARTSSLIWGFAKLVSYASSVTTLEPGDILTSGTPAGVAPVDDGDRIALDIEGLGMPLAVYVSADGATPSPTGVNR